MRKKRSKRRPRAAKKEKRVKKKAPVRRARPRPARRKAKKVKKAPVRRARPVQKKASTRKKTARRTKKAPKMTREMRRKQYLTRKILSSIQEPEKPPFWSEGWHDYRSNFIKEWKEKDTTYGRVVQYTLPYNPAPNPPPNSWGHVTLSEGMGFGMRLAVKNHDQIAFDAMLRFLKSSCGKNGLMQWCIDQRGVIDAPPEWQGSSSDGDIDIAYALCQAAKLVEEGIWNSSSHLDYAAMARQMIKSIRTHNLAEAPIDEKRQGLILLPGTRWGDHAKYNFNPSHVAPVEMRMFKEFEPGYDWDSIIHNNIALIMKAAHPKTGLIPEGFNPFDPSDPTRFGNTFSYDACRLPMRLAEYIDYLVKLSKKEALSDRQKGDMEAIRSLLSKQIHFFYHNRHPDGGIYSGYTLGGTPKGSEGSEACFNGPISLALAIMLKHKAIDRSLCPARISDLENFQLATHVILLRSVSPVPKAGESPEQAGPYYNASLASLILSRMKEVKAE